MSSEEQKILNLELTEKYLNELSKELKKEFGRNAEFEMIVVGGAAIMINYNFRASTTDIDMYVSMGGSVKGAARRVADKYGISDEWLNSDFKKTSSFSHKIVSCSKFYKRYNQILSVRTISGEYLIAMKLASFRPYKRDKSDIIGILEAHQERNSPITFERVDKAVTDLYGTWDKIEPDAKEYIKKAIQEKKLSYKDIVEQEKLNKVLLINFEQDYGDVLNEQNINDVLKILRKKKVQKQMKPRETKPKL